MPWTRNPEPLNRTKDDDPICEGAARCASVSIAMLGLQVDPVDSQAHCFRVTMPINRVSCFRGIVHIVTAFIIGSVLGDRTIWVITFSFQSPHRVAPIYTLLKVTKGSFLSSWKFPSRIIIAICLRWPKDLPDSFRPPLSTFLQLNAAELQHALTPQSLPCRGDAPKFYNMPHNPVAIIKAPSPRKPL